MPSPKLEIWTIYRPTTRDYPGKWVARMFAVGDVVSPSRTFHLGDSLEEIRSRIPVGLHCIPRHPDDDPVIEEVWL